MTAFSFTMLLLTVCVALELTTGAFTKLYKHLLTVRAQRRVLRAELAFNTALDALNANKTPANWEAYDKATAELQAARFLRDVTA